MVLFLLTFFSIYGGVHLYAFFKARAAIGFGWGGGTLLVLWMVVMTAAPVLVRLLERGGFDAAARLLAVVGYYWMGLIFLFFSAAVALDLLRLLLFIVRLVVRSALPAVSPQFAFTLCLAVSLVFTVYGYFEARNIRTESVTVKTPKIPASVGRVRIVQLSDVHLGLIVREKRLKSILAAVREAAPDILVSTGDLVDGQMDDMEGLAFLLSEIQPKYGKYAVTGNHEYYAGLDHSLAFTKKAGFTLLRGEGKKLAEGITIVGLDDPTGHSRGHGDRVVEKDLLSALPRDSFTVLLKHRPVIEQDARGLFDLQLSGHVHKGQIFPFNLLTHIFYRAPVGRLVQAGTSSLYVSRGSGTWGPPIRFLAPPEVTVIDVIPGTL
ncbi:MAG: metallophosphoesterase [Planctomycetota bacterium]|jgi:predicted MPP superfamily phosphohydrolase